MNDNPEGHGVSLSAERTTSLMVPNDDACREAMADAIYEVCAALSVLGGLVGDRGEISARVSKAMERARFATRKL